MKVWSIHIYPIGVFLTTYLVTCSAQDDAPAEPPITAGVRYLQRWNRYNESQEPIRYSYPDANRKTNARWLIVAGRMVVPSYVYRVVVQVMKKGMPGEEHPMTIRAALTFNHQQIAFGKVLVHPGDLSEILLQIPTKSIDGDWHLRVEGREGWNQLPIFKNSTKLKFTPQFLTILIQTSRPIYMGGQKVYFRAVMLTRELRPYEEPVDIYVLDTQGTVMRRWPSRPPGDGVINLNFELPEYPLLGNWTIMVQAGQQIQNKSILVELYFRPRFEVFVRLPHAFKITDRYITGVVVANMTRTWRDVYGNCTVKLQMATNEDYPTPTNYQDIYQEYTANFTGWREFNIPMDVVAERSASDAEGMVLRVLCIVGDAFGWRIEEGWALTRIIEEKAKVTFLGDQPIFFRPGMPLIVHIFVSYNDDHPLDEEELEDSILTVTFRTTKLHMAVVNGSQLLDTGGVAQIAAEIPADTTTVDISARFMSSSGLSSGTSLQGVLHHSPRQRHLQVETSTSQADPGEFIVLHIRNNFYVPRINFAVISDGLIVYSGRETVRDVSVPTVTTFSLTASSDMAPVAKILVWVVDQDGEVVAHSVSVPINPLGKHAEANIEWNEHKDHTGGSAEITMVGETGSYFSASSIWEETHLLDSGHDFDEARILQHMIGSHESSIIDKEHIVPHVRIAATRARDGTGKTVRFYPTPNAGPDAPSTFNFSDTVILTDAVLYYHPSKATDAPQCEFPMLQCFTGSCYLPEQRCNGIRDCPDSSDEAGCILDFDPERNFRLYRISRLYRLYDPVDGDWAWQDMRSVGSETQVFPIPKRAQNWVFSMFAIGREFGLGLLQEKKQFDSAGPFCLVVEGPAVARMWEQVGLNVVIFNFHQSQVGVMITVPYSEDYTSIVVEDNGVVDSYNPRKVVGTFQHVVWLEAGESRDVQIPIVFTRMGDIEVNIIGSTQMMTDGDSITIQVIPEGATIQKHTSLLLDLRNRALVYEFLNIHLDETPIVPYTLERRYMFGTPQGRVSITGDIVGPAFPTVPVTAANMVAFEVMGAETSTYNFAANILSLHYLRLTNQINDDIQYKVLAAVNVHYAAIARYQLPSGGFTNWIGSEQSVWLTAHILRNLQLSNFQDWENEIYIDKKLYQKGVSFLLEYQTDIGSFMETPDYIHPLDAKVDPRSRQSWMPKYRNISLTGHVLMALTDTLKGLEGDLHRRASFARKKAMNYLESVLNTLTDPYDLAVVAWALTKADSSEKELAFSLLDQKKRQAGDKIYWSRAPIAENPIVYEDSQRPYLQPKNDNEWDAHAVESTSYALLVYIRREGIGILQENIVRFLASMREQDGGMISTVDSLVAMEALVEYSYRARIRDITNMNVWIEMAAVANETPFHVQLTSDPGLSEIQIFDLENIWGHLSIVGHGAGQALLQLDYTYGVDLPSELDFAPVPSFEFLVNARYFGRNNSYVAIRSCQRWINLNESETSGLAVVEIHLPSGYYIVQDELIAMVNSGTVRNLRWAFRTTTAVKFFFNNLDEEEICFNYQIQRWYPVSNMSRFNLAWVYELFQPERLQMELFESHDLYTTDICEVCGSFQCPYCPFYSQATPIGPSVGLLSLTSLILTALNYMKHIKWRRKDDFPL